MLERLADLLERARRVLLTTHENPDCDGISSVVALHHHLEAAGREVRAVIAPPLPDFLGFLDPEKRLESFHPEHHAELAAWPDLWLLVDASEPHRLGPLQALFEGTSATRACLDHHLLEAASPAFHHVFSFPEASASAQLVFELLLERQGLPLPEPIAEALYAGIVDDTGNFRFSNATARVHHIAADLIAQGVRPDKTYRELYQQGSPRKMRILGRALESLRLLEGGRHGSLTLTRADMGAFQAAHEDLEGLVNRPLELKGVEVASLFTELDDGRIKASLRSRDRVDVNAVCRRFGGGGHRQASGAKLEAPLEAARTRVDAAVAEQLRHDLAGDAS